MRATVLGWTPCSLANSRVLQCVLDAHIAFQSSEDVSGQMCSVPLTEGLAQTLTHLVDGSVSQQRRRHVPVADVEVERIGPMPTKGLIEF
jgi:hypothetical protein